MRSPAYRRFLRRRIRELIAWKIPSVLRRKKNFLRDRILLPAVFIVGSLLVGSRLLSAHFPSPTADLRHVLPVARYGLAALASDLRHMLPVTGDRRPPLRPARAWPSESPCHPRPPVAESVSLSWKPPLEAGYAPVPSLSPSKAALADGSAAIHSAPADKECRSGARGRFCSRFLFCVGQRGLRLFVHGR